MDKVGIRDLKIHLSRHLRRVRAGARLLITERGRTIATIVPVDAPETPPEVEWARRMVAEGRARWNGGKPSGANRPARLKRDAASSIVLEDRR